MTDDQPSIAGALRMRLHRYRGVIVGTALIALILVGYLAMHHLTREVSAHAVIKAFDALPPARIAAACALTAISYLALTFYDRIALGVIGKPLGWRKAALASFASYTLSHNFGLSVLTGGSARYRIYSREGLDAADVARVVAIAGVTFWTGVILVAAIAMLLHGGSIDLGGYRLGQAPARMIGGAVIAGWIALVIAAGPGGRVLRLGSWSLPLPSAKQAVAQAGVAAIDLAAASAALFVLVPEAAVHAYPAFFLGYALAIIAALISHVPGGLGIFEAMIVAAVPGDHAALLAALLIYRVVYYLLPLGVAAIIMLAVEGRALRKSWSGVQSLAYGVAPLFLSAITFAGGVVLLVSGSLPALPERLRALHAFAPMPFIEASHIAASLVGTALLYLAPGLLRRLDGAWFATRTLLLAGAVFSIAKGLDYEEAAVLLVIAGLLQWTRPAFYRRTALTAEPLSPGWLVATAAAFGVSLWIGFFAYKHVAYQDDLWWHFTMRSDASRFLRASLAAGVLLIGIAVWRLMSPARVSAETTELPADVADLAFADCDRTDAMLAWTGDKRFLVAETGDAFLMYQVKGASWIVMGDPVGPREAWPGLLWAMRARADAAQGRLLLYQLGIEGVALAIEMGLNIVKYGEEARIPLANFSLDGSARRNLRHSARRAERDGVSFEIILAADVPAIMGELRAISDQWLAAKGHGEKSFSLGRFDPAYMARFDCAVVRHQGRIVAFANIWATANHNELSVDLMRNVDAMPPGTMDYLFAQLMLWGRAQGFDWFSLGVAPLSGIEARRLSPMWAKAASFIFRHGDRFYAFAGLRAYKDKFGPVWEPRYIAGPRGFSLLVGLVDLQNLIGGDHGGEDRHPRIAA